VYNAQPPQVMYSQPQPAQTPTLATPPANNGFVGQPTPANTARLSPVETTSGTVTK